MTKREEQINVNRYVISEFNTINSKDFDGGYLIEQKRLRTCKAYVLEYSNVIFLISYDTIVAIINKNQRYMLDVLRYVYGYTATSAQHIAKFRNDYSKFFDIEYTWKEV